MKTCVFITGTNCAGKSTIARCLQNHFGGVKMIDGDITLCEDSRAVFAGKYNAGRKHGGVDALNQTKTLADIVTRGLQQADVIFCEGSYFDTFGMNLLNAMFNAQSFLYVFLYCDGETLMRRHQERLLAGNRTGGGKNSPTDVLRGMLNKQKRTARSAKKWQSIGVPVICIDTSLTTPDEATAKILERLRIL